MMLAMNLTKLSHAELADAVSQRCAEFGNVKDVTILQPLEKPPFAFALVGMKSSQDVERVVKKLGAIKVGALALFRIEQVAQPAFSRAARPDLPVLV